MTTKTLAILLTLAGMWSAPWRIAAADTPEQVYQQYFTTIKQQGVVAATDFIHPDELARFKQMLSPIFEVGDQKTKDGLAQAVFGKTATPASVQTMSPADFLRGFMRLSDQENKSKQISLGDTKVIGSVKEGDIVHLVTRHSAGTAGVSMTELEVVSMKPYGNSWKLLMSGKLEGIGQAIKAQFMKKPTK